MRLLRFDGEVVVESLGEITNNDVATVGVDSVEHTVEGFMLQVVDTSEVLTVEVVVDRVEEHTVAPFEREGRTSPF